MEDRFQTRHVRNASTLSAEDMQRIASARVAVVGCGGLGGRCIDQLARIGVGSLVLIDQDRFEPSNLNRQVLCRERDMGVLKAHRAAEYVGEIDGGITVEAHAVRLDADNASQLLAGCDCVVDALDSVAGRRVLAQVCREEGIPLVFGAVAGWFGQVALVLPGDDLYEMLYGAANEQLGSKKLGNLACTCGATASYQVAEVVKALTGKPSELRNRLLAIDMLAGSAEMV